MKKLASSAVLVFVIASLSWTCFRATSSSPVPAAATQAAVDPYSTDAAYRHRNNLPNHWRGYIMQPRAF